MIGNLVKKTSWGLRFLLIALGIFLSANAAAEDFNSKDFESGFTLGATIGSHPDWFDGNGGPLVTTGSGVAGSIGLDSAGAIFTWTAHPFIWSSDLDTDDTIVVQLDFKTSSGGILDDDRVGLMTASDDTDSDLIFGVQVDPEDGNIRLEGYWDHQISVDEDKRPVIDEIAGNLTPATWYRLRAEITKLTDTSARIDASLTELDASGDPVGPPVLSGTIDDTSMLGNDAPDVAYFADTFWPAYKNHTTEGAPADNAVVSFLPTVLFAAIGDYGYNSSDEQDVANLINFSFLPDVIDFIVTTARHPRTRSRRR